MNAIVPRPEDVFYFEITDSAGITRYQIDADDEAAAYEEIDLIFDGHDVVGAAHGALYLFDGTFVGTAFCFRQAGVTA